MSLLLLCRHGSSWRRAARIYKACRSSTPAGELSSFFHGNQCDPSRSFATCALRAALTEASCKPASYSHGEVTLNFNYIPSRKLHFLGTLQLGKFGETELAMAHAKDRDTCRKGRNGSFYFDSARLHQTESSFWSTSVFCRGLRIPAGKDQDDSEDFDEFFTKPEAPPGRVKSSRMSVGKRQRPAAASSFFGSDDDEDGKVPRVTSRKRKASAIEACEDYEEEDSDWDLSQEPTLSSGAKHNEESENDDIISSSRRKSASASKIRTQTFMTSNSIIGSENRAASMKKKPVALESMPEIEIEPSLSNSIQHEAESKSDSDVAEKLEDEELNPSYADVRLSEGDASDNAASGPSHLSKTRFDKFPISPLSIKTLHSVLKYERMTQVQEATFPVILEGKDVLAKARTGTGKTIAFLLPAIETILKAPQRSSQNPIYVLIVCPTRELAQQAAKEAQTLLQFHRGVGAQVVYGGNSIRNEQMDLKRKPCQILVGTPGRLVDHTQRTTGFESQLSSVKVFVLDEADHMLDMGFRESLQKIMRVIPSKRQTLLFSATIPAEVHSMARVALRKDHVFIDAVGKDSQDTHAQVKQQYVIVPLDKQLRLLYAALQQHMEEDRQYKVLVFCTTARTTSFMCKLFQNLGLNAREIHSRKDQAYRTRVSDEFRHSKGGIILFTSDVSARGVDYPNVTLVVQVGAPSEFAQYIHRLGRTGRAGKKGEGLLILAPWEDYFLEKLQMEKLPVTKMPAPKLTSKAKEMVRASACQVERSLREMAYTAWLGYYRSLKGVSMDKVQLVEYANQFSASMGFEEPPSLSRQLATKMQLAGVPGIRIFRC